MRDCWYADKRDLVKWGVLTVLAKKYEATDVLQIAYCNPSEYSQIEVDGEKYSIPDEVLSHFRDIKKVKNITGPAKVSVFDLPFFKSDRAEYHEAVSRYIQSHSKKRTIVFLDPDTGLEPNGKADYKHVLNEEVRTVWDLLPENWLIVIYQHQTNRSGIQWVEQKRAQFATALGVAEDQVKVAHGLKVANDVAFFFSLKHSIDQYIKPPYYIKCEHGGERIGILAYHHKDGGVCFLDTGWHHVGGNPFHILKGPFVAKETPEGVVYEAENGDFIRKLTRMDRLWSGWQNWQDYLDSPDGIETTEDKAVKGCQSNGALIDKPL